MPDKMTSYTLQPVDFIRLTLKTWDEALRQRFENAPDATIEIEPRFADALLSMEIGHELLVITWMHKARRDVLKNHPRGDETQPLTGVFYTRSPVRPNPIELHPVTVREINGACLKIGPIEVFDGTPAVDIKSAATRRSAVSSRRQQVLMLLRVSAVVAACSLLCGCGGLSAAPIVSTTAQHAEFYVGSHGWHTSIILSRRAIAGGAWPRGVTTETFAGFDYLEVGWGDRKFYTAPKPNVAMALDAVLSPGPSVLHVVGLNSPIQTALPWSALVRVPATREEVARLCRALGESFGPDTAGEAVAVGPGLYGKKSRFYAARGRYYLFNTCDTWTARMMRAGGLPADTSVAGTWSAGAVIAQARRLVAKDGGRRGSDTAGLVRASAAEKGKQRKRASRE